jgi:GNAT superfamily N-acetyltransferase
MSIAVRPACPEDSSEILRLLRLLAAFEQSPDGVIITEDVIRRDGFGGNRRFEVLLAEVDGRVRGAAVLYLAYSSWRGAKTLMIHDLFVEPVVRGVGIGRALLAAAARRANEDGCCRMDVNVLAWNAPARRFYRSLGFSSLDEWLPYRLDRDGMVKLADTPAEAD